MSAPYDLCSLAAVQAWSPEAASLVVVPTLITQVSRQILSTLNRPSVLPTTYTEVRDGDDGARAILGNWPVIAVSSLVIDGLTIPPAPALASGGPFSPGYVLDTAAPFPPGEMQGLSLRGYRFCRGRQNVSVAYTAGYQVVEPVQGPGDSYIAQGPFGAWASDGGVVYAAGAALAKTAGAPGQGQYAVAAGVYTFNAADAAASLVITYGYVPFELANAAAQWVGELVAYRGRIGQRSKSLGGQETTSFIVAAVPANVQAMIQPYRRLFTP
ncbi:MAG: hypothetical protein ACLPSW_01600 [Roseiarcus sp.]